MESKISYNDEKIAGLQREVNIKVKQVQDLEGKYTGAQDELDMTKYKLQELMKDLTEHKLKIDVFESQVTGLKNEKQHLQLELKETKELQKVYEKKCSTLISEINIPRSRRRAMRNSSAASTVTMKSNFFAASVSTSNGIS